MNRWGRLAVQAASGVAGLVLLGWAAMAGWGPITWGAVVAGGLLLAAMLLAGCWPLPAVGRWLAGMLLASGLTWLYHLRFGALLNQVAWRNGLAVSGAVLLVTVMAAAPGPWLASVRRNLRGGRLLALGAVWVYATARWYHAGEWRGDPESVARGLLPLLTTPLAGLALIAAARQIPEGWLQRASGVAAALLAHERRLAGALALAAVAVSAHLCYRQVGPLPHVEDGIAYLYQAKTFLAGGFYQPAPVVPGAFDARFAWVFMDDAGRSYGIFPPGWPLLLAAGVWLGVPWSINPLLCGLAVLLLWRLLRAIDGPAVAAASCLLLLTSPFFLLQGASFLSHPATLLWILVALNGALGVETTGSRPAVVPALLLGLGVGLTLATRYVEGLLLGLVLGSYLLAAVARRRVVLAALPLALLGLAPGLSLALVDNAVKTGSPWVTPVERWYTVEHGAPLNRPGFGPRVGLEWDHSLGPGHSLFEGLWNTNNNLFELNRYGFGWACGSLVLALIHLGWGRRSRLDSLLLAYSLGLAAVYTAYWYHGVAFGPRFFHPLLLPLVAWTTKGVGLLGGWLGRPQRVAATLLLAVVVAWATWLPLELLTTYHHNRGREADDREIVALARAAAGGRPALVIQRMERRGPGQVVPDYGIGFSLNPPGFRGDVLVARELNQEGESQVAALRRAFGERVMLLWYKNAGVNKLVPLEGSKREQ